MADNTLSFITQSGVMYEDISEQDLPENYIYISHLEKDWGTKPTNDPRGKSSDGMWPNYWWLPCYPDEISDTMSSTFQESTALGRTAPVYTYSRSGPRTVQVSLTLHRDMFDDYNTGRSNADVQPGEDYIDSLIRALQSIALPKYNASNKMIEPPIVALRLGDELFIKGIVNGGIGMTYGKPILYNNRYAVVTLTLNITEIDPYDAKAVFTNGGFRGVVSTLKKGMGLE